MIPAYHIITNSLLTGATLLSVIFFIALCLSKTSEKKNGFDLALLVSSATAVFFIFGSILTGAFLWNWEAVLNSPLLKNKLMIVSILTLNWTTFLILRLRFGASLWNHRIFSIFSGFLIITGFLTNMMANSIGGEIAGNGSGFEQIVQLIGIETRFSYYLPNWVLAFFWGMIIVAIILGNAGKKSDKPHFSAE